MIYDWVWFDFSKRRGMAWYQAGTKRKWIPSPPNINSLDFWGENMGKGIKFFLKHQHWLKNKKLIAQYMHTIEKFRGHEQGWELSLWIWKDDVNKIRRIKDWNWWDLPKNQQSESRVQESGIVSSSFPVMHWKWSYDYLS